MVPRDLLPRPGLEVPGCPPNGARIALDLELGERTWVRWLDGAWVRVPDN